MKYNDPIKEAPENFNDSFLTIEDLYVAQDKNKDLVNGPAPAAGASSFRRRGQSSLTDLLWMAKDMDLSSPEFVQIANRVDTVIKGLLESGQKVEIIVASAENTRLLDPIEALEQARNEVAELETTGILDLDYAMHQVRLNGAMLEELSSCKRFKGWAQEVYTPEGFTPIHAMDLHPKMPFADMVLEMEKDISDGVRGGLRHPNALSLRVGAILLMVGEGESQRSIPLMRLQRSSNGRKICDGLYGQAKDFADELQKGLEHYRGNMMNLPDDWPTAEHYKAARTVAMTRYHGDNGLMENDFYNGEWIVNLMSTELHQARVELLKIEADQKAEAAQPVAASPIGEEPVAAAVAEEAGTITAPANLGKKIRSKKIAEKSVSAESEAPARAPRSKKTAK